MELGPEGGVGVAIAKAVAIEQQDCGSCINWEIVYLKYSSIKDTLSPLIYVQLGIHLTIREQTATVESAPSPYLHH